MASTPPRFTRLLRVLRVLPLALACGLAPGCAGAPAHPNSAVPSTPARRFEALVHSYFDARFRYNPDEATTTGVHTYDAALDDLSAPAVARYGAWLDQQRAALDALLPSLPAYVPDADPASSDRPQLDAELLRDNIQLEYLRLVTWRELAVHPSAFHSLAADAVYQLMVRDFAPLDERVRAATARLRAVPSLLRAGEAWLDHPPQLAVDVALREIDGSIEMVRDIFPAFAAHATDEALRVQARDAATVAAAALEHHKVFLRDVLRPRADGDYHDGRERWVTRVRLANGVTETPEQLREAALGEVRRLQAEMRTLAARLARPGEDLAAVLARQRDDHPAAAQLLDAYRAQQSSVRAFVRDHAIATIDPARDDLTVEETPGFLRATMFAALSAPGALERVARRAIFYVTPADTTRPPAEIAAYLTEHSNPAIVVTTIHEAYPGHHVQGMHQRQAHSLVRQLLWHDSYGEGWAHYAEQMLVDQGFGDDVIRLDQRQEALLRAARAYLDVSIHVFGLGYDDAVRFYRDEAFMSQPGAEIEARRVCLQPATVLGYTYGKFAIYRLRAAVLARPGATLAGFHNALLDFGSAPIPRIARALYGVELGPWTAGETPTVVP